MIGGSEDCRMGGMGNFGTGGLEDYVNFVFWRLEDGGFGVFGKMQFLD